MYKSTIIFVATILVACAHSAKLPSYFKKCKKTNDEKMNDCLLQSVIAGYPKFIEGDKTYHIPSMVPLHVPLLHISLEGGLTLDLSNVEFHGYESSEGGYNRIDLEKKKYTSKFTNKYFKAKGDYSASGQILILPISGNGTFEINMDNLTCYFDFEYDLVEKNNKEYIVPKNEMFKYEPGFIHFQLNNLFNGNKLLGDEMNKFLNENWKEVDKELGTQLGNALGTTNLNILKNFFAKVPFSELFDE